MGHEGQEVQLKDALVDVARSAGAFDAGRAVGQWPSARHSTGRRLRRGSASSANRQMG